MYVEKERTLGGTRDARKNETRVGNNEERKRMDEKENWP